MEDKPWFGYIEIGKISNQQNSIKTDGRNEKDFVDLQSSDIRFVHYPDCQQLIIWLPRPGSEYGDMQLLDSQSGAIVDQFPVKKLLNGSLQLLWDTLTIQPGAYRIIINWKPGFEHILEFVKHEQNVEPVKQPKFTPTPPYSEVSSPIIYRNGAGKIIENEDLLLQEKLKADILKKFTRHVEYEGTFHGGTIIYIDNETVIRFSHEMGGGHCMFYIEIPTTEQWEAYTKTPLSKRKDILDFVATTVQRQQAPNTRFEMKENEISFFYF